MKLGQKIFLSLLSILALLIIVSTATYLGSRRVEHDMKKSANMHDQLIALTSLRGQVRNLMLDTYEVILINGINGSENTLTAAKSLVMVKLAAFEKTIQSSAELDHVIPDLADAEAMRNAYQALESKLAGIEALAELGDTQKLKSLLLEARENYFNNNFVKPLNQILENKDKESQKRRNDLRNSIAQLIESLVLFTLLACIAAGVYSTFFARSIGGRFAKLEEATQKLSKGEFDIELIEKGSDEFSILARSFNLMASSMQDAKNQLQTQQQLLISNSKMSALGEMAGGIAHEINTPLAVIRMKAEQLEMRIANNDAAVDELNSGLEVIKKTVDRIAAIVTGLKFFARDGRGAHEKRIEVFALIADTLSFCRERFASHGVQLKIQSESSMNNLEIECRIVEISQSLLNLLNNAFDAVSKLPQKWIEITVEDQNDFVHIIVEDSGTGIDSKIKDKIMQPFFTTKDIGQGTGLGLSITKGIIEDHGGQIYIDDSTKHTRFVLRIPKRKSSAA